MLRFGSAAPTTPVPRLADLIARWMPENRLGKSLAEYSDDELDNVLACAGKTRADLFAVFKGNEKHRQMLALMIEHFGVDRDYAARNCWDALRYAEQACIQCTKTKRCRSWFAWGSRNDAPRVFCPNAALLDEIARAASNSRPGFESASGQRDE